MAMASPRALAVLYGFFALFLVCCPQLLGVATTTMAQASTSEWGLQRLAAAAFFPAVLLTLVLTPLLSFAHVRALGRANAGGVGGAGDRLVEGLAKATVLAATVAVLACAVLLLGAADGAVVQIGADGHLDRGRGDVARLNIK